MQNIDLVTSDLWIGRPNIFEFQNPPGVTLNDYHEMIIKNWNSVVKKNENVLVLGNLYWDPYYISRVLPELSGNIILLNQPHPEKNELHKEILDHESITLYPNQYIYLIEEGIVAGLLPFESWPGDDLNIIHLHGYTIKNYSDIPNKEKRVPVGLSYWNWKPVRISEIKELLKIKQHG